MTGLRRTGLLCACVLLLGYGAAAGLTHDFQVWTQEGARRLAVARQPVPTPAVTIDGPGLSAQPLPRLLAGQVTLADFFYTRCQTVCLSLGSSFQQMQAELQRQPTPGLQLLSLSFDGAHDTPQALAAYARQQQADPALWHFARVPDPTAQATLLRRLGVTTVPNGWGDYEHNAALLVLDAHGRLRRIFDLGEHTLALNYARHLAQQTQPHNTAGATP